MAQQGEPGSDQNPFQAGSAPVAAQAEPAAGLIGQLRSMSATFWTSNAIEMCERLSYYGLRTVLPVYLLLAVEKGGPQFDNVQKASMYAWWAGIQSFIPVFSGGYADRFGYRRTVAVSVGLVIAGYLMMGHGQQLAALFTAGASTGVPGHPAVFAMFMVASTFIALGTAVFKPGLQGMLATQLTEQTSSFGWGIFYQVVNVGGFVGPIMAGFMRVMDWVYVFYACAAIAAMNWILLLFVREPEKPARTDAGGLVELGLVAFRGMGGIMEPRLFAFLATFSGFWAMFYQLYDLLPNFIDDWVDSRSVYQAVMVPLFGVFGSAPPAEWNGNVPQEMMLNLNAGMIMLLVSFVGYLSGFFRSMTNMIVGILISAGGIWLLQTRGGVAVLFAIAVFSIGEMFASPTKMRYVAGIAPPGKKALYLGYVNATVGIGWTIGSMIAGPLYEETGDKVSLARRYLVNQTGMDQAAATALPKSDVLTTLAQRLGTDVDGVTNLLWNGGSPAQVWVVFCLVGLISMVGMIVFDQITRQNLAQEELALIGLVAVVTAASYGWLWGLGFGVVMLARKGLMAVMGVDPDGPRAWLPGSIVMSVVVGGILVFRAVAWVMG